MPKFLEDKLKKRYGKKSKVPYKIMNSLSFMHGNKETESGKKAEEKHQSKFGRALRKKRMMEEDE